VINHIGSLDAGHYTAFVRQQRNHWFKCDDHLITRANLREVLDSEGSVDCCLKCQYTVFLYIHTTFFLCVKVVPLSIM
jgi:ubiquitin C-terminal hydrolase